MRVAGRGSICVCSVNSGMSTAWTTANWRSPSAAPWGRRASVRRICAVLPFESGSYDLVTALDVLEHIEDDCGALAELARVCRPGGRLLLTVPSFPSLWSDHDIVNHHVRRYHPRDFRELISESGLNIQHESGMNFFLLPVAYLWRTYRKIFRQRPSPQGPRADNTHQAPPVNALLRAIFSAESPLIAGPGLPLGLSILCLAEKREA